ncbi:unnamed protein product, partial [Ceratitis capitata]
MSNSPLDCDNTAAAQLAANSRRSVLRTASNGAWKKSERRSDQLQFVRRLGTLVFCLATFRYKSGCQLKCDCQFGSWLRSVLLLLHVVVVLMALRWYGDIFKLELYPVPLEDQGNM